MTAYTLESQTPECKRMASNLPPADLCLPPVMIHPMPKPGISEADIIDVTPRKTNVAEALYLPAVFKGLGTTLRHVFQTFGRDGKNKKNIWVVQYPEEKRDDRPVLEGGQERSTFRGVHRLNRDEDGRVRCVACFMCATACPAHCIHIVGDQAPGPTAKSTPSSSISTNSAASTAACAKRPAPSTPSN